MANRKGKSGISDRISFFQSSEITVYGDCSHKTKRCLLHGKKNATNLDSRDITLPTKVYIVAPMIFPVFVYECESWTIKKTEH